jgi:alginate O-acetyltransferase complex protein AlgJ
MIKHSERVFLALIVVTFLLPAPLTLWVHCGNLPQQFDWIANRTLNGVTVEKNIPPIGLPSWLIGNLQNGINTLASENFAGRELLIRVYDQILYETFHKSYMYSEMIIPGKHGDLFERDYLLTSGRFMQPIRKEETEALVVMMKYLSEELKERGSCFVLAITPSKATLYPEDIPGRYLQKIEEGEQRATDYEILVPLLKKYCVPYVDGREITLAHKETLPVRAFPKTGTHWSRGIAFFTTAALLKTIERESGKEMPLLTESVLSIDHTPDCEDGDLSDLLNRIQKSDQRYLHPGFHIPDNWPKRKGILTFVGGSFVGQILNALDIAQVFERINYYYYFKVCRYRFPGGILSSVDENAIPWEEDFWNTEAVVLEANEAVIAGRHLRAFLMDEMAALQQKAQRERGIGYPTRPLAWGFGAGESGSALPKKGFCFPEPAGTWIAGQDAEIELPSPAKNTELQLIFEAIPALGDGVAKRTAKLEVNGIPVGALELADSDYQFYSLTVRADANNSPFLKVHFSLSPAPSTSVDGGFREIGLARLALVPTKLPVTREDAGNHTAAMFGE